MARRVESAPLCGRHVCARLRLFAIDELTGHDSYEVRGAPKAAKLDAAPNSRGACMLCMSGAAPEHASQGLARRRANKQKSVRRLPEVWVVVP